jgi:hypothetical protein
MVFISARLIPFLVPFIVTIPSYIFGRRIFFKDVKQAEMHLTKSGKIFTAIIGLIHLTLTVALYILIFLPELWRG